MLDKETITQTALAKGFKLKEQANGEMDLNLYVYEFANAIAHAKALIKLSGGKVDE